ncbi:acyl-CoA dehydrogenase family protein, partial [Reyranella sp.]|uniref:acyl-CoA dehydrogenase family protein n=1 Tax=Reyranella sp. TaxID=1929291 RepID=UPI002731CA0D
GTLGMIIDGTEEQRQKYLPKIAAGQIIASFCLTEPDAGSDVASLTTRATADGEFYVINGTKHFTTNSPHAGLYTVFARTGEKGAGSKGIAAFLVERDTPGISIAPHYKKMGFRGSHTADVTFEDCSRESVTLQIGDWAVVDLSP